MVIGLKVKNMKYALFIGCNIPARVPQYELSAKAVLKKLDIDVLVDREFKCCGYPLRNIDFKNYLLFAARNLALAEKQGLDLMTLCKCCFGALKKANHILKSDKGLREEVNTFLAKEKLTCSGNLEVTHFLSVLHNDVGLTTLKENVTQKFEGLHIATHYGCHALRPSDIMQFDNPVSPVLFDDLVNVTGAKSIDWPLKLECCGAPVKGINDALSMDLTKHKLADSKLAGADYLCVSCPWCQIQFDSIRQSITDQTEDTLSSILYSQLLGFSLGIGEKKLGLENNGINTRALEAFLSQEKE